VLKAAHGAMRVQADLCEEMQAEENATRARGGLGNTGGSFGATGHDTHNPSSHHPRLPGGFMQLSMTP
jgi:hypothetical protein